jgi:hypothetical protein
MHQILHPLMQRSCGRETSANGELDAFDVGVIGAVRVSDVPVE